MAGKSKPAWEKSSDQLIALFETLAPKDPRVAVKKMFGWPCCFVNGNLFAGLHKQGMIFRLSDADRLEFLELEGAADFEPMPGHKMKGYTIFADALNRDPGELKAWIGRSLEFARSLPEKKKPVGVVKKARNKVKQ